MIAVVLLLAGIVVLGLFIVSSLRAVTKLTARVEQLDRSVQTMRAEQAKTDGQLDRVDVLLARADEISSRVESTSRLAYNTLAAPVIKAFAVGKGTTQAARSLRQRSEKS
jgi:cell division protein FtsB